MDTEIIKINKDDIDEKLMEHAGELIAKGELVAFPTETVYGPVSYTHLTLPTILRV